MSLGTHPLTNRNLQKKKRGDGEGRVPKTQFKEQATQGQEKPKQGTDCVTCHKAQQALVSPPGEPALGDDVLSHSSAQPPCKRATPPGFTGARRGQAAHPRYPSVGGIMGLRPRMSN